MERPLSPDETELWARVLRTVRPLRVAPRPVAKVAASHLPAPGRIDRPSPGISVPSVQTASRLRSTRPGKGAVAAKPAPSNTLDGSWDRRLSRGLVSPDRSIDLHGHSLATAYAALDAALEQSIRMGDRVVLLVTGKPPRPTSERAHAPRSPRGAIRAAIGDWLAGSRHAGQIAAVRAAHPRHGGAGALYIILKKAAATRIS